jgi:hypothetical protein
MLVLTRGALAALVALLAEAAARLPALASGGGRELAPQDDVGGFVIGTSRCLWAAAAALLPGRWHPLAGRPRAAAMRLAWHVRGAQRCSQQPGRLLRPRTRRLLKTQSGGGIAVIGDPGSAALQPHEPWLLGCLAALALLSAECRDAEVRLPPGLPAPACCRCC